MKIFTVYLLLLIPCLAFGQLFPKIPDFNGNVKKVIEKRYGKELPTVRSDSGAFKPGAYSGWKYLYLFNEKGELQKRISTFQGRARMMSSYETQKSANKIIKREITRNPATGKVESMVQYENTTDEKNRIIKADYRVQSAPDKPLELVLFETDAKYRDKQLISFLRHDIRLNGDTASAELCTLKYNNRGNPELLIRKDLSSGISTTIRYYYNGAGWIDHYSIDLMSEIREYGREQIQEIYFKCDRHGNWTRMYWKSGEKKLLEAKRIIRYF